jgi:hypothetical protein
MCSPHRHQIQLSLTREFCRTTGWARRASRQIPSKWFPVLSAHFFHAWRRATSRKSQSGTPDWLMPDQQPQFRPMRVGRYGAFRE